MEEASRLSERMYEAALEDGSLEDQAWFAWQLSRSVIERGNAETAATFGRLAVALFRQLGAPQYEQFALVDLAAAFAIGGHQRESRETLGFMDALGLAGGKYFSVNVLQARGWMAATNGDLPAAMERLREGTEVGLDIGDLVGAAGCAHSIARLGAPGEAVPTLERLAADVEGPLMIARLDHVRALVAKDANALEEVAARLDTLGATLLAAEAAADAAIVWRDQGSPRRSAAALRLATKLADRCERPSTPALSETRRAARLTPAERTAAMLAANGRTSREIAEELVVSLRTVENHLQHVYEKLGIRGRAELRGVEGLSER
jgi:DNA-binding CsgD family transcriptional regulator